MNTNFKFSTNIIKNEWNKDLESNEKKYTQLYKSIKTCITNVDLPDKWLLPSTRYLSAELKLSRTTVVKAYELLQLENLIESKAGSGYKVSFSLLNTNEKYIAKREIDTNLYPKLSSRGESFLKNYGLINRSENEFVAFRPGLPPLDAFPVNQWKNLLNNYWRYIKSSNLSYAQATGLNALKDSIKNYLYVSRNIRCKAEQIIVLSGSLQSLYLISNVLINEDDHVVLENPSFPNVHSVFKSLKADLIPIDLDKEGLDIDELSSKKSIDPKVIHLTPSNHYPLGIRMSIERRKAMLDWASYKKTIIIENDYENEISNHKDKIPSIFSLDKEQRTVYMGTFNRLLHPSIRLGFMVVPEYLIQAVNALQEHSHRFVAPSIQVVMNQFIERNYLYKHLNNIVEIAKKRHEIFTTEFSHCKSMTMLNTDFCSLHVYAVFNDQSDDNIEKRALDKANKLGITALPLSKCYISIEKDKGLIFGYSAVRESILNKKLNLLKTIL
jgi:GntR family transcriptional regulator/MocR family aminotransferase